MATVILNCRRWNRNELVSMAVFYCIWCHERFRRFSSLSRVCPEFRLISNNPRSRTTIVWHVESENASMPCTMNRSTVTINRMIPFSNSIGRLILMCLVVTSLDVVSSCRRVKYSHWFGSNIIVLFSADDLRDLCERLIDECVGCDTRSI